MDDNPAIEVADRIADLKLQLARLTQMVQTGFKLETVSVDERQSVKDALSNLFVISDIIPFRTICL